MRRRPLLLPFWGFPLVALIILLWSATAAASDLHPIHHAEDRLWRIERRGAPPSHIMGTIHIADPRVRALPAPIHEALEGSEKAAFELLMPPADCEVMARRLGPADRDTLARLCAHDTHRKTGTSRGPRT